MRYPVVAFAFLVYLAFPQASSAEPLTITQSRAAIASAPSKSRLPELLQRFGFSFISRAQAAECTAEGETCTSNEQCCPGLQCAGGPPATCSTED
jgi:hypothetical protein